MDETGAPPLRPVTRRYIGVLVAAVISYLAWQLLATTLTTERALLALAFAGSLALVLLFPLPFAWKTRHHLDMSVIVAAALIFQPAVAVSIVVAGLLAAQAIRREPREQFLFDAAQLALQAVVACSILSASGWDANASEFGSPRLLLVIAVAGIAMYFVDTIIVSIFVGLEERILPLVVWLRQTARTQRSEVLAHLGQVGVGLLAAVVADAHTWALVLLLPPTAGVYGLLRLHTRARQHIEEVLRGTEANLEEAQRIAHLGSWEWDLVTGHRIWSNEAYRIMGLVPGTPDAPNGGPGERDLLHEALHPDDRVPFGEMFGRALRGDSPASIDHRVVRPDGTARIVHSQVEVIPDASGRPARVLGTLHDISDRKQLEERLKHQAFHDALTGLPNRALFNDRLQHALARTARQRLPLAVLFLDLDHFKLINDTLGHEAGDQLLITLAERIRACLRPSDTVARLGGDEFTILLEDLAGPREAEQIAGRITAALDAPFSLAGQDMYITTSIGIVMRGQHHRTPDDMLRDADVALYRAKDAGRARFAVYDVSMGAAMHERVTLEADLRRSIERHQLHLEYQPQFDLSSGSIVGVEAFIRWMHPERGVVTPSQFLPIAEETGLIAEIDAWALEEACRQARDWHQLLGEPIAIAVNLSGRHLRRAEIAEELRRLLRWTGLDPRYLKLEFSETAVMADAGATAAMLGTLLDLGVQVVIDDFGTGYTSLSHLRRFPVDTLKLDGAFVAGLGRDGEAATIAEAIVGLAHSFGLRVVAEGVERVEQLDALLRLRCELGQGNLFSVPLDADSMTYFLQRHATRRPALLSAG
jgi:diguanylate cyclase (GGDEF)-like protein